MKKRRAALPAIIGILLGALLVQTSSPLRGAQQSNAGLQVPGAAAPRRPYVRLSNQRIVHEPKDYTAEQRVVDPTGTANYYYRTALHDPELGKRLRPWGMVGARRDAAALEDLDREIVQARITWLTHDDYGWGHHISLVAKAGLPPAKVANIPKGVSAGGWTEREAALLAGVDELHTRHFISDETWSTLAKYLTTSQLLHYVFVAGMYHSQAMYAKSIGFPSELWMTEIPRPYTALPSGSGMPPVRLSKQRIAPVNIENYTVEQHALDPAGSLNAYYRTTLHDPWIGKEWQLWLEFMMNRTDAGAIPTYERELAVLRINWLCHDDYAWGRHVQPAERAGRSRADIAKIPEGLAAGGWNAKDTVLLTAVDELYYDYFISDETWNKLTKYFSTRQILDLILLTGTHYVSAAYTNTIGVPRDEGIAPLPER